MILGVKVCIVFMSLKKNSTFAWQRSTSGSIIVEANMGTSPTVDAAPPKKPWNDDSTANTKNDFNHAFQSGAGRHG